MSMLIFIIVLSILIIVHEWGHFITAKKLGVRVERFSVGFGPCLYSKLIDGTQFMVCAVPLGGYVKMAGDERRDAKGEKDEFFSQPVGRRALIILNGPVVNYVFAFVCLVFVFILGYPDLSPKIGGVLENYPAVAAGLKEGDIIISIDHKKVESWGDIQKHVALSVIPSLDVDFKREGQILRKQLTPRLEVRENIFGQKKETRLIGVKPSEEIILLKYNLFQSISKSFQKIVELTVLTYKSLYFMATGTMSAKESMTGPIGIFFIIKAAAAMGFSHLLYIMGVISASLAIFNLLPVIPLDGGHLFLLAVEKIRRKPLPPNIDEAIARIGVSLIICLAIFVFYSDFSRFGWIDKIKDFWPH